jgi:integrase
MTVTVRPYKRGGWEVDIVLTFPGRPKVRERKKCPLPTKAAARRWGEDRERQLIQHYSNTDPDAEGKDDLPGVSTKEVPTLAAFIPRYMEGYCKANRERPSTITRKESNTKAHLIPKLGHKRLDRITAEDLQALKASMDKMAPVSANTILKLLQNILNVAVEWKVIKAAPVKIKKLRQPDKEVDFYDFDVYERLVTAAADSDPRTLLVVLLGGEAGLRRGEIIALEWSDVDLKRRVITIARSEFRGHVTETKGHRFRTVPITDRLAAALKAHRHLKGPRVLYSRGSDTPGESTIRFWLAEAQTAAKLKVKGPHTLRHTFCSHLAMRGAPARAIQKLAGHQSVVTTERYMHLSPVALEESMRLINRPPVWRHGGDGAAAPDFVQ